MSVVETGQIIRHGASSRSMLEQHVELVLDVVPRDYFRLKSLPDRIAAALFLIPGLPIIGLLILAVRLTSRGPGIFRQVRTGKDGKPFMMLKIRTMVVDAEAGTGAVWAKKKDPRVTWLGKILRKLHLDEFPQLFNVLRGEMAFVGPRPERPEFVSVLKQELPGYENRLAILPGVTGLAQINLPPDTDLESVRRKLALDLAYIEEANAWLDTRMFLCTFGRVLGLPGVMVTLLFGLRRHVLETDNQEHSCETAPSDSDPAEEMTPAKLSHHPQMTVAKVSMSKAIRNRLSSARTKAVNTNGNGKVNGNGKTNSNGKVNGQANGNGKPHALVALSTRNTDPDNAPIPHKPR